MIEFEKPNIHKVEETDSYGKFVVEPLERGYGTTLGNSLRRVLLASLPGAAITSIQIDGVLHEFSTVEGVTEDVTQIILNLKKVSLKLDSEEQKDLEIFKAMVKLRFLTLTYTLLPLQMVPNCTSR